MLKKISLISVFAMCNPMTALAVTGSEFCAKTTVGDKVVPITDPSVGGRFEEVSKKLSAKPDQDWLEAGRKDPFYHIRSVPLIQVEYPNGQIKSVPDFKSPAVDQGMICEDASAQLGGFLGCLEGISQGGWAVQKENTTSVYNAVMALNNYLPQSDKLQAVPFLSDFKPGAANQAAVREIAAKLQFVEDLRKKCSAPGCSAAVDRLKNEVSIYSNAEHKAAIARFTEKKFKEKHGIPNEVYFEACNKSPTRASVAGAAPARRTKAPVDPIAALFRDESGAECNLGIPRVVCHTGDEFDAKAARGEDVKAPGDTTQPMTPGQLPPVNQAVTAIVKGDVREFMINNYLSGWKEEAARSLNGAELNEASHRLESVMSCKSGGTDTATFTPKTDEAAQKEKKLQGALAAVCVNRLNKKFALLQAKHGLGFKATANLKEPILAYLESAKKNMSREGRERLELAMKAAALSENGLYLIPGVAQIYPLLKVATISVVNTSFLALKDAYDEKNKCAGMYPADSPLFQECSASFALMTDVGAESSALLRAHPALEDNGGQEGGALGFQRIKVDLPEDVKHLVDSYVPSGGQSCVEQARKSIQGRESEVSFSDEVFASGPAKKRMKDIETQLAKFCSDSDSNLEVEDMLLSHEMMARYFSCEAQPPFVRSPKKTFGCAERGKFAWAMCRENLRITAARSKGKDAAGALGEGLPVLMEAMAVITPVAGIGRAALGAVVTQGGVGAGIGGGLAYLANGAAAKGSSADSILERERAKLASGLGSARDVGEAQAAVEEFNKLNSEWLAHSPVLKATLEGFVTGALFGAASGGHGIKGGGGKIGKAYSAARLAEEDAQLLGFYHDAKKAGAFELQGGKQLEAVTLAKIRERAQAVSGGKLKAKDLAQKPVEEQLAALDRRTPLEAKKKAAATHELEAKSVEASAREKVEAQKKLSERDPELFTDPEILKVPGELEGLKTLVEGDPVSALAIEDRLIGWGNKREDIRKFFRRLAKECPRDKAGLALMAKECGVVLKNIL